MDYEIISSSSSGNCIVLENIFMLDCGVPYKKLEHYLDKIKVIFISHRHSDHLNKSTVKRIAYEYPSIKFLVGNKLVPNLVELNVNKRNIICLDLGKWYDLGLFKARLDFLTHDVPNCCLHLEYHNKKMLYAVDTSTLDNVVAKDYDLYLVEGNYEDEESLEKEIIECNKRNEFTHLYRVRDTHMSQVNTLNWLNKNMNENSEYRFIHQHKEKIEGDFDNE